MTLRIVGAGLGRTGTHSLKLALEQLLGGPCYHMVEVFGHQDHVPLWHAALNDESVDWNVLFDGYVATVDWPSCGVWESIAAANPDALVLLSTRASAEQWWQSASNTIFMASDALAGQNEAWHQMVMAMFRRFTPEWPDETACKAAYERHNAHVRATVPPAKLIDWQPADGWSPLCDALGVPVPDQPFPVTNTTADFRAMAGLDPQ